MLPADLFRFQGLGNWLIAGPRAAITASVGRALACTTFPERFCAPILQDVGAVMALRRLAESWGLGEDISRMTDDAVVEMVAARTREGRLAALVVRDEEDRLHELFQLPKALTHGASTTSGREDETLNATALARRPVYQAPKSPAPSPPPRGPRAVPAPPPVASGPEFQKAAQKTQAAVLEAAARNADTGVEICRL